MGQPPRFPGGVPHRTRGPSTLDRRHGACQDRMARRYGMRHRVIGHVHFVDPIGGNSRGHQAARSRWASRTTTTRRPTTSTRSRRSARRIAFRFANASRAWIDVEGRSHHRPRSGWRRAYRCHDAPARQPRDDLRGCRVSRPPARSRSSATAGFGSRRQPADAPEFRRRARSIARRSSRCRPRWHGPP